jgi:hypothetical protein
MSSADQAREPQLKNVRAKTGKSLGEVRYKVFLTSAAEVDKELLGWFKTAYDGSG